MISLVVYEYYICEIVFIIKLSINERNIYTFGVNKFFF